MKQASECSRFEHNVLWFHVSPELKSFSHTYANMLASLQDNLQLCLRLSSLYRHMEFRGQWIEEWWLDIALHVSMSSMSMGRDPPVDSLIT